MMIVKLKFRQQKTLTKQGSIKVRFKTNYLIASFNALPDTNAGISMPACLRETGEGGLAATPEGIKMRDRIMD